MNKLSKFLVVLTLFVLMTIPAFAADVTTDKGDYSPGEIVLISGSGFNPGAGLTVTIIRPDTTVESCDAGSCNPRYLDGALTADGSGSFAGYRYDLNGDEGQYYLEITDGDNTASTTFLDANMKIDYPSGGDTVSGVINVEWHYLWNPTLGPYNYIVYYNDGGPCGHGDITDWEVIGTQSCGTYTCTMAWDTTVLTDGDFCVGVEKTSGTYKQDRTGSTFTVQNNEPECEDHSDCDHLDTPTCSGDYIATLHGVCNQGVCEPGTTPITNYNCNDEETSNYCEDSMHVVFDDYTCENAQCVYDTVPVETCADPVDSCLDEFHWQHYSESCFEGACLPASSTGPVDDGLYCNGIETCTGEGVTVPGTPVVCNNYPGAQECYEAGVCDEEKDTCVYNKLPDNNGPVTSGLTATKVIDACQFNIEATETDVCSFISEAEYFLGSCGEAGTGTSMEAVDGNYDDELVEEVIKNGVVGQDGGLTVYVRGRDMEGNWGECEVVQINLDCLPPDYPSCAIGNENPNAENPNGILINDICNAQELLVCGDNPTLTANICDSQSTIQLAEYFLDDMPLINWQGIPMDATDGDFLDELCEDVEAVIDMSKLEDGTHYVQLHGKDDQETWGKLNQPANPIASFIKDTTAPNVHKELLLVDDLMFECSQVDRFDENLLTQANGNDLTHGCYFMKSGSEVKLWAVDPDPQGTNEFAGAAVVHFKVWWSLNGSEWEVVQEGQSNPDEPVFITLNEESFHLIEFWTEDLCGNEGPHYFELDVIDTTAPITEKNIYGPQKEGEGYIHYYLTDESEIVIQCHDQEPHPVGFEALHWEMYWSEYCDNPTWEPIGSNTELDGWKSFTELRDSCHKLVYWCEDALGNLGEPEVEIDAVDNTAPYMNKTIGYPSVQCVDGPQPTYPGPFEVVTQVDEVYDPTCDYYISQATPVELRCVDQGPHPVNNVTIYYYWTWDDWDDTVEDSELFSVNSNYVRFNFPEDSQHTLHAWCEDELGNMVDMLEVDYVDTEGPEVFNKYFDGDYVMCEDENQYDCHAYITQDTTIYFEARDVDPHPVGIDFCLYRYKINDGEFTEWTYAEPIAQDRNYYKWQFSYEEDSVHTMEYRCVDYLDNWGPTYTEIDVVDTLPPRLWKEVGEPKVDASSYVWEVDETITWDWYVTQQTPITLYCEDVLPHPVDDVSIYWYYERWDGKEWVPMERGFEDGNETTLYYGEDSWHHLIYWCEDALGNIVEYEEYDIVDTQAPETLKTVGEPKVPLQIDYPGEAWLISNNTEITFECTDFGPHPVDDITIYWRWQYSEFGNEWTDWSDQMVYDGPITFQESSFHEIEYWCVDSLGNEEQHRFELDAVDHDAPVSWKEVGEPKVEGEHPVDWWITQNTEIALFCEDVRPHPVGGEEIYFKWKVDDGDFNEWRLYEGPFVFDDTDSNHTLKWYCVDAFGNKEEYHWELDSVDTAPPEIDKFVRVDRGEGFGERIYSGPEEDPEVVGVQTGDMIKFCADVHDVKLTSEEGVGVDIVRYRLTELDDPIMEWDEVEQAYCHVREATPDCGKWHYEVQAMDLLGNFGEWEDGIEFIIDNVAPIGEVLNPHAGNNYYAGKIFPFYAPAVDFGGRGEFECNILDLIFTCGENEDCPASGVDYCEVYAIDYPFENLDQDEIKSCYEDLWEYFGQVLADPYIEYIGRVPYEDGVCKGYLELSPETQLTDTVFMAVDYVDKADNHRFSLALNPWLSPITMNIEEQGSISFSNLENLDDYVTSGDAISVEAEIVDSELSDGNKVCQGKIYMYEDDTPVDIGIPTFETTATGNLIDGWTCDVGTILPFDVYDYGRLESGNYKFEITFIYNSDVMDVISVDFMVDNDRPELEIIDPRQDSVYGETFDVKIWSNDEGIGSAPETVYMRIHELGIFGSEFCLGGCKDSGWQLMTEFDVDDNENGVYIYEFNATEHGIDVSGKYMFDALTCDKLYVWDDTELPDLGDSRNAMHCRQVSVHGATGENLDLCYDHIDNDNDGLIDEEEPECQED